MTTAVPATGDVARMFDPRWDSLTNAVWDSFARAWIAELSGRPEEPLPKLPVLFPDDPETTAGEFVVPMNFTASAESQWRFIDSVFRQAHDDNVLDHLAAGPIEQLLSKHGDAYIARFERLAREDNRFARMLSGCNKHLMSDAVWSRLQESIAHRP